MKFIIYWIKEEVAYRYFYKSDILYRFIKQYERTNFRLDLSLQYNYITSKFSKDALKTHLENTKDADTVIRLNNNLIEIHHDDSTVQLNLNHRYITFDCQSLHEAETLLLTPLRTFYPFLFIVHAEGKDFGWISPVTKNIKHKNGQLLYSNL